MRSRFDASRRAERRPARPGLVALALVVALLGSIAPFSAAPTTAGSSLPSPDPGAGQGADLSTSDLTARRTLIPPGQAVTFTLSLRNTGPAGASAHAEVQLPEQLALVPGSVSGGGGVLGDRILWQSVAVAAGETMPLFFEAVHDATVSEPITLTVGAVILTPAGEGSPAGLNAGEVITRSALIVLLPGPMLYLPLVADLS